MINRHVKYKFYFYNNFIKLKMYSDRLRMLGGHHEWM